MNRAVLRQYARLIIESGVNLQEGEIVCINAPVSARDLVYETVAYAYEKGADRVLINWYDPEIRKLDYTLGKGRRLLTPAEWEIAYRHYMVDNKVCYINMLSGDPEVMADVPHDVVVRASRAQHAAFRFFSDAAQSNVIKWCIVGVPDPAWAVKVFPSLPADEALDTLWRYVLHTVRLDTADAVEAWRQHNEALTRRAHRLNEMGLVRLHYTNSLGTDLYVGMPDGYLFEGGSEMSASGTLFNPNMPTEEIFSAPHKYRVEGKVVASMPLYHHGVKVQGFGFEFRAGRIERYWAAEGEEVLKGIIESDEGSHYLGEVALVPYDSPISNLQTLFLDTLFDENASCHLAIGAAYPSCVAGGLEMDEAALEAAGINDSAEHVDFMIGTADLSIVGETRDGTQIQIFDKGNFVF